MSHWSLICIIENYHDNNDLAKWSSLMIEMVEKMEKTWIFPTESGSCWCRGWWRRSILDLSCYILHYSWYCTETQGHPWHSWCQSYFWEGRRLYHWKIYVISSIQNFSCTHVPNKSIRLKVPLKCLKSSSHVESKICVEVQKITRNIW